MLTVKPRCRLDRSQEKDQEYAMYVEECLSLISTLCQNDLARILHQFVRSLCSVRAMLMPEYPRRYKTP